jgi:hypothetical protein
VNSVKGRFFTSGTVRVSLRGASLWEGWLLGGKSHCWRIRNPSAVSASEIGMRRIKAIVSSGTQKERQVAYCWIWTGWIEMITVFSMLSIDA